MVKNFIDKLNQLTQNKETTVDPGVFNHPLAETTQWTPLSPGGANFKTYQLVPVSAFRMEFRPSLGKKFVNWLFLLIGLGVVIVILLNRADGEIFEIIFPISIGLIFAAVGGGMAYHDSKPLVIDKMRGFVFSGGKEPMVSYGGQGREDYCEIGQIAALQIISEWVRGNKTSFYSYELNFVLRDGNRRPVTDHGNLESIRSDAQTLSQFLGVPIWDATQ